MPTQSIEMKGAGAPTPGNSPRYAGAAVALFGLLVIASWFAHWQQILQMLPDSAPMQFNTALCFVLLGAGLFLLTTRRANFAQWLAVPAVLLTFLTLPEYLAHRDFGIDQMFLKPFFEADTVYPGRMSPLTAFCFILAGSGIIVANAGRKWAHRLTATGVLACIVGVIAFVALFGFLFHIAPAYSWGSYSRMAVNTAVAFLILASGLVVWCRQMEQQENFSLLHWLPVAGSVTLMVMMIFVTAVNAAALGEATFWRRHTIQVILHAQAFQDNLSDLQRGARTYVTQGDAAGLAAYERGLAIEPEQFDGLVKLTADNPSQQLRLKELGTAMEALLSYDRRMIALHDRSGAEAVLKSDANGERRSVLDGARGSLRAFAQEEQRLLEVRDALEHAEARDAARLLTFGSVLAATLVLVANFVVGREMKRRRAAEIEREGLIGDLRRALDEVKTLSGMIPICGWCKCIRSDEGYWQSVEQYVGENTDATFTHGICPGCLEKFKADLV
jgi:CHASE3 domain sensor protein